MRRFRLDEGEGPAGKCHRLLRNEEWLCSLNATEAEELRDLLLEHFPLPDDEGEDARNELVAAFADSKEERAAGRRKERRERIASQALQGILANPTRGASIANSAEHFAADAIRAADALITALNEEPQP